MLKNAVRKARRARTPAAPVPFPVFDDIRHRLVLWIDELEGSGDAGAVAATVIIPIIDARAGLLKVRGSVRHERMAEFLDHCVIAIQNGHAGNARCILLMAMAIFGWPTHSQ